MDPINDSSGLRIYGLGIVTQDKTDDDGDMITVAPMEDLPLILGRLKDIKYDYNVSGVDHKGASVSSNVSGVAYFSAKWTSLEGGNRNTAPNVCEGETVLLLKYASTEDIYWTDYKREPALRRLENVLYAYSNLKEKGQAYDLDTSHWVRISSRDQIVQLHTSNNRDEKAGYDITLNLSEGTFQLIDTNKNEIFLDSVNGDLRINTNRSIEFNTKQIRFNAEEYVHTETKEIIEHADTITNHAEESHTIISGGTTSSEATTDSLIKGNNVTTTAQAGMNIHGSAVQTTGGTIALAGVSPVTVSPGIAVA